MQLIILDYKDQRPINEQVTEKLQKLIINGILSPDEKLPSVRSLAMELSVNPNTVQRSYTQLENDGFIYTVKGRGNYVSSSKNHQEYKKMEYVNRIIEVLREAGEIGISSEEMLNSVREELEKHDRD